MALIVPTALFYRVAVGSLTMFFQQWTGVNAILYYAPFIFKDLGLTGNSISLLATGVVGIAMFLATIPAVIWVDQAGRKPILVSGAFLMAACHIIVAILTGLFHNSWETHRAAGWAACALVWLFAIGFGYSWGPCSWILVAEIWPLSVRGKGVSIAASSNWMNNFIGKLGTAISTVDIELIVFCSRPGYSDDAGQTWLRDVRFLRSAYICLFAIERDPIADRHPCGYRHSPSSVASSYCFLCPRPRVCRLKRWTRSSALQAWLLASTSASLR